MKTLVVGATTNPDRYANIVSHKLLENGYHFIPLGFKSGLVAGKPILDITKKPLFEDIHTITLYLSKRRQEEWVDYLLSLKPKRIIFNPGTENEDFSMKADKMKIHTENSCTLVLLSLNKY